MLIRCGAQMVAENLNVQYFEASDRSDPFAFNIPDDLRDSDSIVMELWSKLREGEVEHGPDIHISHQALASWQLPSTIHKENVDKAKEEEEQRIAATRLQCVARSKKAREETQNKRKLARRKKR